MRYFYDTEFIEDGQTIELVSVGVVAEDGREYYAVSTEFEPARANSWVREHVLDKLPSPSSREWKPKEQIKRELEQFLTSGPGAPELWAWVGAYDHVVVAQLWGDMSGLPKQLPRYTRELKQYWEMAGRPKLPGVPRGNHNALVDARHNAAKFAACADVLPLDHTGRVSTVRETNSTT